MKAEDFRIGNYYNNNGNIRKITPLVLLDLYNSIDIDWFSTIPLTEEWLFRLGFEKVKGKIDIYEKRRLRLWIGARGQTLCYLIEENTTTGHFILSIEYVHQIQNLYYALTGKELTLKETI